MSLERLTSDVCHTECGDSGCQCVDSLDSTPYDHLLILDEQGTSLGCICVSFRVSILVHNTLMYHQAFFFWGGALVEPFRG